MNETLIQHVAHCLADASKHTAQVMTAQKYAEIFLVTQKSQKYAEMKEQYKEISLPKNFLRISAYFCVT